MKSCCPSKVSFEEFERRKETRNWRFIYIKLSDIRKLWKQEFSRSFSREINYLPFRVKNIQYHPVHVSREYPRKSLQIKLGKKGDKYVYRSTKDLPFCESTVTTVNTNHSLEPFARSSLTVFLRCDFTHAPFFHPLPRLLFSFFLFSYKLVKLSPSRSNLIPLITRSNPPSFLSVCPLLSCRFALFTFPFLAPGYIPQHFCSTSV